MPTIPGQQVDLEALARADINLIVAFEALMQERSVTRAAKRLALSQSAMSHALGRLRDLFDDELFVRSGQAMVPTPRAVAMAELVRAALRQIGSVLDAPPAFSPGSLSATFRVSAFDFAQLVLLPRLASALHARAPGIRLVVQPYERDPDKALSDGLVDLVLGLQREPQAPFQRTLCTERFACAVREGHPCLGEPLTPSRFAATSHAVVSPLGRPSGFVDAALGELGLTRSVGFATPQLASAALAVRHSDMILTAAERPLRAMARALPLVILAPPVPLPAFEVSMRWHERRDGDDLHRYVREALIAIAVELDGDG